MNPKNSLDWLKFVGKAHPKSTIYIQCHCGEMATPISDPDHGSEFLCSNHGVIAFAQAGTNLNHEALRYVQMR